jgi:predicted HicB family RNase H-like nuclease
MSPATSSAQRKMFCIALSMKLGKTPKAYSVEAAKMASEMSIKDLSEFCKNPV